MGTKFKRRLAVLGVTALLALGSAIAANAAVDVWSLSLGDSPNVVVVGHTETWSGTLTKNGVGAAGKSVTISGYFGGTCSGAPYASQGFTTDASGNYSLSGSIGLTPGTYSYRATSTKATSGCVTLLVVKSLSAASPVAIRTDHAYLCYSVGGTPFVAQTEGSFGNNATALMAAGYWTASAVAGDLSDPFAENVGKYHLVCAAPGLLGSFGNAPQATTYTDNNGDVLTPAAAAEAYYIGVYPVIG